ncbi:hypothetical protein LOD99_1726 [Oopsacas minuta]|uniref:Uncharacterized protein n=1 Tax=Oopsacas minuta TaxID=111878 RepID=A0AAV7K435_9METZ|nr:hypothetical protein LOD99_1726 [Oopsacas minuta]
MQLPHHNHCSYSMVAAPQWRGEKEMVGIGCVNKEEFAKLEFTPKQVVSCCETKVGIKRKARESQDSAHHIVGESLQTASEDTAAKLPKLDNLKRTIQRQRATVLAAPAQPTTLAELALPADSQGRTVLTLRLWCRRCTQIPHLRDTTQPRDAAAKQDLAS